MSEGRLARFLLWRLRHRAGGEALASAVEAGLLTRTERTIGGVAVVVFAVVSGIAAMPLALLRRKLGLGGGRPDGGTDRDGAMAHLTLLPRSVRRLRIPREASHATAGDARPAVGSVTSNALETALRGVVTDLKAAEAGKDGSQDKEASKTRAVSTARKRSGQAAGGSDSAMLAAEAASETRTARPKEASRNARASSKRDRKATRAVQERFVRLVRATAPQPDPVDVATLLLLARAVSDSGLPLDAVLQRLAMPSPIVTIRSQGAGFEHRFMTLLRDGLVLPFAIRTYDGYGLASDYGTHYTDGPKHGMKAVAFRSTDQSYLEKGKGLAADVGRAVSMGIPVIAIAEGERRNPKDLETASNLDLTVGPLDARLVGQVMAEVLGPVRADLCDAIGNCSLLRLADLAAAIRPGVDPEQAVTVLESLARTRREEPEPGTEEGEQKEEGGSWRSRRGKPGSGSELVEPETVQGAEAAADASGKPRLSVETLSGYGAARDWALAVKDDLAPWRDGQLDWSAMSTRILLSGPPGTGKTTFARALCNTLNVPLLVTSAMTWLEPSYLGDVLKRMRLTFEEAEAKKPVILFIDEIDALGRRQSLDRHHADYWNAIVNRALELLDGVTAHEGIIVVGATNRPDDLDPALLRSGRLERHVRVDLPDTEALVGILAHHLGRDLPAVLETAGRTRGATNHTESAGLDLDRRWPAKMKTAIGRLMARLLRLVRWRRREWRKCP